MIFSDKHFGLDQFMRFSDKHSSLVTNVWILSTGFVSPRYKAVLDDLFHSMYSSVDDDDDVLKNTICN